MMENYTCVQVQDMKGFITTPKGHMWTACVDKTIGYGAQADTISLARRPIALSLGSCSPSVSSPRVPWEPPPAGSSPELCAQQRPLKAFTQPFPVAVGTEFGRLQPFCLSSFSPVSLVLCFPDLPMTALP